MIRILSENDIDHREWDDLLNRSPYASFFQSISCFEFYKRLSFLSPFVYGVKENNHLSGLIMGYVTSDAHTIKGYFTRRAIVFGGALLDTSISSDALSLLLTTLKFELRSKAIYTEIRNFHDYSDYRDIFNKAGFNYTEHLNFHVATSDYESAFKQLNTTKRRHVRVSLKAGVERYATTDKKDIAEFYEILSQLYHTKIKSPLFPISFFEELVLLPEGKLFVVKYNGKVVGGSACVELPDKTLYEWFICGADGDYKNIYPSTMATWVAIEYAANQKITCFDMMGAGKPNEGYGVREFKAKFGGKLVEYGRFISVNNPLLFEVGKLGLKVSRFSLHRSKTVDKQECLFGIESKFEKIDKRAWQTFVENHPDGNIFQTPQMYELYASTGKFKPVVIVALNQSGHIVGCLMSVIQREYRHLLGELTTRSIVFGGPLAENNQPEIVDALLQCYNKVVGNKAIYTQFRNLIDMSVYQNVFKKNGFVFENHLDILLDLTKSPEELEQNLHKERKRNIAKAEKEGLEFRHLTDLNDIAYVVKLLKMTYLRVKIPMSYEQLFVNSKDFLGDHVHFFGAYLNDKMIAGQVRLYYKNLAYAWFSGSDSDFFHKRPNDFLMWNVLLWSKENGYKMFDFGGAGKPGVSYGVRDYKLKYGGELVNHGRYVKTHKPFFMFLGQVIYAMYKRILR